MNRRTSILMLTIMVVVILLGVFIPPAVAATRISNTAHASWSDGGQPRAADSNRVDIDVDTTGFPPATITTYRPDTGPGPITSIRVPGCDRGGVVTTSALPPATAAATYSSVIAPSSIVRAGDQLIFTITAAAANRDPAAIDTVIATITTASGDRETLTVYETGIDTGEFSGTIATRANAAAAGGDCALALSPGDTVTIEGRLPNQSAIIVAATLAVRIEAQGLVIDSDTGAPVSGARVTLVDADTGQPARVFASDGATPWPATVVTGQTVTDGGGAAYVQAPGEYYFPLVPPGRYRLIVEPPSPYTAPSVTTDAQLAGLTRPDGSPLALGPGSRGGLFALAVATALRIDVPVDRPAGALGLTKTASLGNAQPGDQVLYTLTVTNPDATRARRGVRLVDVLPAAMRLRADSVRIGGQPNPAAVAVSPDGRQLTVTLGTLAPSATATIRYALTVLPTAPDGQAINSARAVDALGVETLASASVRIDRETIAARMTVVGRIVAGPCTADRTTATGIPGIRVMLEDGSYAITDRDGRYHFEGLVPGSHVVQVDPGTLPTGGAFVDCTRSTRSAGSATSRFVEGQGGSLVVADFQAMLPDTAAAATPETDPAIPAPLSDKAAAGAERNWFDGGSATIDWLFPEAEYNPRQPAIRIAIRHLIGQTVALFLDGKPVDAITFDGTRNDPANTFTVSLWRGVPVTDGANRFTAEVRNPDGSVAAKLSRTVYFTTTAARAEYLPGKSRLTADGVQRPVIAVRFTDRQGRPVHAGTTGDFALPAPYEAAVEIDAEQARLLSGLERAAPVWRVAGDDGIAYIQLGPTTTSGALTLDFTFRERDQMRRQKIETWLSPGNRPWTIVGLAEGRLGFGKLANRVEPLTVPADDVTADGRIAFYAKGRIKGSWLLTAAYDSAKKRRDQRLTGAIDPNTYYTVYADRSERRYDAASTEKLYLKLETRQFYALFGDFETNLVDTELARYVRSATGGKAEYRGKAIAASAFVAKFPTTHRRDEIQGNGLSTGYVLSSRSILANSETVTIEVRDRLRSERIVERRTLVRFIDYDIDYATGTIRFSSPVLSRSSALDPQFVVIDYEVLSASGGEINAGARATWTSKDERVRIGATALRDAGDTGRTMLGAADARIRLGKDTEIRGEVAASRRDGASAIDAAWLVEFEQHTGRLDLLAYARSIAANYGVDQQNGVEVGRRKVGVDVRYRLSDRLAIATSAWADDDLTGDAQRRAVRSRIEYKSGKTDFRLGVAYARDRTDSVSSATSTLIEGGATQRLFGGKLELDAAASVAIGKAQSVDFPAQYRIGARYQLSSDVILTGAYEIAHGESLDARTARIGFDLKPWAGARLTSSVGNQESVEYGHRAFAAYGLAQSFQLGKHWSIDATLDGSRTLSGIDASRIVNPLQPVASGGYVGSGDQITENFTALTFGGTYRAAAWSGTGRVEYRFGQLGDRAGATFGLIRRLGEGASFGALATWTRAERKGGATTETLDLAVSGAWRPAASPFAALGKLAWVEDRVAGAVAGQPGPVSETPLIVTGNAASRRVVGSLSVDWAPQGRGADGYHQRNEVSLFLGGRYVFDRIDAYDLAGLTVMGGIDARIGLGDRVEIGVSGTIRGAVDDGNFAYAYGPSVGVRPADNMLVTAGWNVRGFADRDFADARTTRAGPYVALKLKFDQDSFAFLGLNRR